MQPKEKNKNNGITTPSMDHYPRNGQMGDIDPNSIPSQNFDSEYYWHLFPATYQVGYIDQIHNIPGFQQPVKIKKGNPSMKFPI